MKRYRKKRNLAVRRKKNMIRSRTIRLGGSAVHFEHDLSTIGPYVATSIKGNLKEEPR